MTTYAVGEHVDLLIRDVIVGIEVNGQPTFITDDGPWLRVDPAADNVTITRRVPADGVPQPGDIWVDAGGERWVAVQRLNRDRQALVELVAVMEGSAGVDWEAIHRSSHGPISLWWREPAPLTELVAAALLAPDSAVLPDGEA